MKNTSIEWTDHTFNPWWGCEKVSPACANCYAETFSKRTGNAVWGKDAPRRFFDWDSKHWKEPLKWDAAAAKEGQRKRVFCSSMADVFEDRQDLMSHRAQLFNLIYQTPHLDWLILTKRPENIKPMLHYVSATLGMSGQTDQTRWMQAWLEDTCPPGNIWLGTTVENQALADKRIPALIDVPANIHFLSCEPLLGPVDLSPWLAPHQSLHWVIAGGESGPKARPSHPGWIHDLQIQCFKADVPFFFKQWGEWMPQAETPAPGVTLPEKMKGQKMDGNILMLRAGKARAGHHLAGNTWLQIPRPQ